MLSAILVGGYSFTKLSSGEIVMKGAYKGSHIDTRNSGGAIAGKTGAPGEGNCTDCHTGTANLNSQMNQLVMTVKGTTDVVTEYEPGQTYTLALSISGISIKKGFQTTARTLSDNLTAGDLAAVAGSTARITQAQKQFINHASGTTSMSNFAFDWTAPAAGSGDVRFYVSSNHTNANGNTSGDEIHLSEFTFTEKVSGEMPVANFDADVQTICAGEQVTFTSTSTGSPTEYSWSFQGGSPLTSTDASPVVTFSDAGTYEVQLTVTNGQGSDTKTAPAFITVNPIPAQPTITSSDADNVICSGTETVTLTSSTATEYSWSNGESTQAIEVAASGKFALTVIELGCESLPSDTVEVVAENCASLEEQAAELISVYPNPTSEELTLKGAMLSQYRTVEMIDLSGKRIASWSLNNQHLQTITLSGIDHGVYQLRFVSKEGKVLRKVIQISH